MRKKLKYIKPQMEFLDIEICDVLEDNIVSGNGGDAGPKDWQEEHAKQEDFIFDTSEDFDSPYHLFDE